MNRQEHGVLSEVARVVENYNTIITMSPDYDGTGQITLVNLPDDPEALIESVQAIMLKKILSLRKAGHSGVADEINACVNQIQDAKEDLR